MVQTDKKNQIKSYLFYTLLIVINLCFLNLYRHGTVVLIGLYTISIYSVSKFAVQKDLYIENFIRCRKFLTVIGLFFTWIALSACWSYDPAVSIKTFISAGSLMILLYAFYNVLSKQTRLSPEKISLLIIITFLISVILLSIQQYFMIFQGESLYATLYHKFRSLKPNAELICILFIPTASYFLMKKKYSLAGGLFLMILAFSYVMDIKASLYGFIIAAVIAGLSLINSKLVKNFIVLSVCSYILFLPSAIKFFNISGLSAYLFDYSSLYTLGHRFSIWNHVNELILQKFYYGWGAGVSSIYSKTVVEVIHGDFSLFPSHTHNIFIQCWFELGLVGAIILSYIIWLWGQVSCQYANRHVRFAAVFFFIHTMAIFSISHSLWHKWWISWIVWCWILTDYIIRNINPEFSPKL